MSTYVPIKNAKCQYANSYEISDFFFGSGVTVNSGLFEAFIYDKVLFSDVYYNNIKLQLFLYLFPFKFQ